MRMRRYLRMRMRFRALLNEVFSPEFDNPLTATTFRRLFLQLHVQDIQAIKFILLHWMHLQLTISDCDVSSVCDGKKLRSSIGQKPVLQ